MEEDSLNVHRKKNFHITFVLKRNPCVERNEEETESCRVIINLHMTGSLWILGVARSNHL